jgi:hypothetical protein
VGGGFAEPCVLQTDERMLYSGRLFDSVSVQLKMNSKGYLYGPLFGLVCYGFRIIGLPAADEDGLRIKGTGAREGGLPR